MEIKNCTKDGKQRSWDVLTKRPLHLSTSCFSCVNIYQAKYLKVVEPLGHSAAAYEAAKERLERKFGGKRRQIALHLEELENFKPLRPGFAKDLERLADLLDVTLVNLKEAGRHDELGNGSLYLSLCKKLTEAMLAQYHRWIYEKGRWQSVETLRELIIQEADCGIGNNSRFEQTWEQER